MEIDPEIIVPGNHREFRGIMEHLGKYRKHVFPSYSNKHANILQNAFYAHTHKIKILDK